MVRQIPSWTGGRQDHAREGAAPRSTPPIQRRRCPREINKGLGSLSPIASSRRDAWAGCAIRSSRPGGLRVQTHMSDRGSRAAFEAGENPSLSGSIACGKAVRGYRPHFRRAERCDLRVVARVAEYWAEEVAKRVRPVFDTKRPTALFVGRYQPSTTATALDGSKGLRRVGQADGALMRGPTATILRFNMCVLGRDGARESRPSPSFAPRSPISSMAATLATPWRGSTSGRCRRSPASDVRRRCRRAECVRPVMMALSCHRFLGTEVRPGTVGHSASASCNRKFP